MTNILVENGTLVDSLREAIRDGELGLKGVPGLMKRIIREDMWRKRYCKEHDAVVEFDNFIDFVTTPPFKGLGEDPKLIETLLKTDPEALDLWTSVTTGKPGRRWESESNLISDNVTNKVVNDRGNNSTYALRKLRKDAPDIHKRVIDGELSPHAGMIEAGFRKKTITITTDPEDAARALIRRFDQKELMLIINIITEQMQ